MEIGPASFEKLKERQLIRKKDFYYQQTQECKDIDRLIELVTTYKLAANWDTKKGAKDVARNSN